MVNAKSIKYPCAVALGTQVYVDVSDARKGQPYLCFGCGGAMVVKQGKVRQSHFAHKSDVECSADATLHEAAKQCIIEGFRMAVRAESEYNVSVPCENRACGEVVVRKVSRRGAVIASEVQAVAETRSDLVVAWTDRDWKLIIEIVVTHPLEPETRRRYIEADIPIVMVKPTWETLSSLRVCASGDEVLNTVAKCRGCQADERNEPLHRKAAYRLLSRMAPRPTPYVASLDLGYERPLYGRLANSVRKLVELGFKQDTNRLTLFTFKMGANNICVDFATGLRRNIPEVSVEYVSVWPVCVACMLDVVMGQLLRLGLDCVTMDVEAQDHREPPE